MHKGIYGGVDPKYYRIKNMDKTAALAKANSYISQISQFYKIEKAFLYGSFAKNNFHKDSDVDLAIVLNSEADIFDIQVDLMRKRSDEDLIIEPHPVKSEDFNPDNPVFSEILEYGIELNIPVF